METKTTMKKPELLAILEENRGKHRQVFEDSLDGYRKQAMLILDDTIKALTDGRTPEIRILLSRPEDHTRDYDRIIKMLQLDIGEQFTMDESMFAKYVMDDWSWKRDWLRKMSGYAPASTAQAYGDVEDDDL